MKTFLLTLGLAVLAGAQTTARFSTDPTGAPGSAYFTGPFPSNVLTVSDPTQPTGLRVNLPGSNDACAAQPAAVCSNSALLNQLDGFSVNPRLMVCFSGPVDLASFSSGVTLLPVPEGSKKSQAAAPIAINRVFFDPATNCAYAKPAQVLAQQTSYLLLVSNSILDAANARVIADPEFSPCAQGAGSSYCAALSQAIASSQLALSQLASASLFTTMSVTPWLQRARLFADALPPLNFPAGVVSTFPLSSVQSLTYSPAQSGLPPQTISLSALSQVGSISFGFYLSPIYLNTSGPQAGTITTSPSQPTTFAPVSYHVLLPASPGNKKIPVVIYGHGTGDNQFGASTYIASTLAQNGFATLALEITGHGYGPTSTVAVATKGGTFYEFTPGRGVALSPGATIGPTGGCIIPGPIGVRDCVRQTAVDLFTLVNLIQNDGLGLNLDPHRIYYAGQSLGALYGTLATAVEPAVAAAVFSGDGGTSVDIARLSPVERPLATAFLASVSYPLLNVAAGIAPPEPYFHDAFNDNYVLPGAAPVTNTIAEAPNVQAAFEAADWLAMLGDPLAFASYLQSDPLPGVPPKGVLFQFGIGDLEVANPTESAVAMAANAVSTTTVFNFPAAVAAQPELAYTMDPGVPGLLILPHRILSNGTIFTPGNEAERSISLALQQQAADFFSSRGKRVSDPNQDLTPPFSPASDLFTTAPKSLPEQLNFVQIQP